MTTSHRLPTRERILRSASHLFAARGYYGTSTRDIAESTGIRQPSLFHHFATKDRIMAALQRADLEPCVARAEQAAREAGSPAVRLHRYVVEDVGRMLDAPYVFVTTRVPTMMDDPQFLDARELLGRVQTAQMSLIAAGISEGEFRDLDLDFANRAIGWIINGLILDSYRMEVVVPRLMATQVADLILRMLLADPEGVNAVRDESLAGATSRDGEQIISDG